MLLNKFFYNFKLNLEAIVNNKSYISIASFIFNDSCIKWYKNDVTKENKIGILAL